MESTSVFWGSFSIVALVCLTRTVGLWQNLELQTLDFFLQHRPSEPIDSRITLLEITDKDLQQLNTYPVPDDALFDLLSELNKYEPSVIGLDIFRDLPVSNPLQTDSLSARQANESLNTLFGSSANLIAIEKILGNAIAPPASIPAGNIGFADALLDQDGFVRRSLLASPAENNADSYHLSFTIQVASRYLATQGFELDNGLKDPNAMRFGETELFRINQDSGGYVNQDTGDNPVVLINFRAQANPFQRISLSDFNAGDFSPEWLTGRIVLIGMTAESTKDYVNSAVIAGDNPGLVPGLELQAHAISQIVSAVLDGRPIIKTGSAPLEYLWIVLSGIGGLGLIHLRRSIGSTVAIFIGLSAVPVAIAYGLLLMGYWLPIVPIWVVYVSIGGSTLLYRTYQHEQTRKIRFEERQQVLERSYNAIHNGPLQTIKGLIRQAASTPRQPISTQILTAELQDVNDSLRGIYEFMQREYLQRDYAPKTPQIYLTKNYVIDLNEPLHELLHQVYQNKLDESEEYFGTIPVKISDFGPMDAAGLSIANKETILRFLEEALCNVEQHAQGVTRLTVVCKAQNKRNIIRVIDNGKPGKEKDGLGPIRAEPSKKQVAGGNGTRQANTLARRLKGEFTRISQAPSGTLCELTWKP